MGLYLLPVEAVGNRRGPKYFQWPISPPDFIDVHPGISARWSMMDYGFTPYAILYSGDILPADHAALILNADVYAFPDVLDAPVADPNVDTFFEAIHLPTDWLTPATTYRELLRRTAGMVQFSRRYEGIYFTRYGAHTSLFESATLSTRLRQLSAREQEIFLAAVESFGIDPQAINANSQLRQLVRQGANLFESMTFTLGGFEF